MQGLSQLPQVTQLESPGKGIPIKDCLTPPLASPHWPSTTFHTFKNQDRHLTLSLLSPSFDGNYNYAMKLKEAYSWKESYDISKQYIKKAEISLC